MKTLSERMTYILDTGDKKASEIADYLDVTRSTVTQWQDGSTKSISSSHVFKLGRFVGFSPEWIATGEGPMRLTDHGTPLNFELLQEVIRALEQTCIDVKKMLKPAEKAEAVSRLYRHFLEQGQADIKSDQITTLVKIFL